MESSSHSSGDLHGKDDEPAYRDQIEPHNLTSTTQQSNYISFSAVNPVDIQVRDLSVEVDLSADKFDISNYFSRKRAHNGEPKSKFILHDVSADMPHGALTAIIGGSGSGKTSLLNTMAERISSSRLTFGGSTTFNGFKGVGTVRSAYVMQQDVLLPTLTVRETLQYSADLRLPPPTTKAERKRVVEEVILELGLKDCADTRIGNHAHKGCSGGEKRRTSIAVQLLSNPSVLFLDEPTTGLDSTSVYQLMKTLKGLAKRGRNIVTTIHQPRSEIWGLLDHLVILSRGSPVYSGKADACLSYFADQGFEPPAYSNPAEFLIDIAAVDNRSPELEAASSKRVDDLKAAWRVRSIEAFSSSEKPHSPTAERTAKVAKQQSPFIRQTQVLSARTLKVTYRDPMGMGGSLVEAILLGIVSGWIFLNLGQDQAGIRSREGALYIACSLQPYLILIFEIYRLSIDIQLFDREHNEGVVDVVPFLLSRRLARFFLEDLPVPLIYSTIFYWMAGLWPDAGTFFIFFSIVLLSHYIAVTLAATCIAASRSFAGASLIANLGFTMQSMSCGYFIQNQAIPVYVRWVKWTAYVFYAFGAICTNEFAGHFYDCPYPGGESNPACVSYTGTYILNSLGFPKDWIVRPIVILLAYSVMFYTLAGLGLRFMPADIAIARARNTDDTDLSAGKEALAARAIDEIKTITVRLDQFAVDLEKRDHLGRKSPPKTILHPVTTNFPPGTLNVIMGPSGSGKTSLLNAMALRLHNTFDSKYIRNGKLSFNNGIPSASVVRSVCSYVCQDDDALLPSLTVRETLRFSACLRLPAHIPRSEKYARAESVLLKMGLKDCADNVIGNELIKGISGGEKRRVTIAVQILTDPMVLLLDEPTSGLDAFTASSIIDVLHGLAQEGRTLILTIHQSRSDIFDRFGNVLLLARGGHPVFAGPSSSMLPHFSRLGYQCPITTNPADFALDTITVDLQHSAREEASRAKVNSLIEAWTSKSDSPVQDQADPTNPAHEIADPARLGFLKRKMAPFYISFPLLLHRSYLNFVRQPPLLAARIMQVLGLSFILTLWFAPLHYVYTSVQTRLGFIQEFCAFYFVGMLQNVAVYPAEKAVFYREFEDGAYSVEAFFLSYGALEVPFEVFTSVIFAALVDMGAGLPRTGRVFWVCFFNCFCVVNCGESVGIMFNTLFSHTGFAVNLTSVFLSVAQMMSGIMSINMPSFLRAMNYLSPIRYAMRNLAPYTLLPITFTCTGAETVAGTGSSSGTGCLIGTGKQVLDLYNLDSNPWENLLALGVCTVVYRLLAWALLRAVKGRGEGERLGGWKRRRKAGRGLLGGENEA